VHVAISGTITPLTPDDRVVAGFSASADRRRFVVVAQPRDRTADLERVDLTGATEAAPPVRLTDHGGALLAGAAPALPTHLRVDDGRGPVLDAWVLLPEERFGPKVPVVLYTGGGPGGMRSDNLHFEWQLFAAHGYAVVWTNARGCQGYGDPFCTAILGSWGGADHEDQMRALDAALAHVPRLDAARQAIAGGSYGGFAVVWALAHTDRFAAAVADRVVVDKIAAFGMSDIGPQRAFEFGGARPWEDPEAYRAQSPIDRLGSVRTPTLVVHSAEDHRCTVGQGEALYAGLRTLGVETRFVRFPNESHGLSRDGRPWHRVRRLQEYLDWFAKYLAPVSARA
jgi:dipeptidyl aminopeptidase/acylaminoacyl peptidase